MEDTSNARERHERAAQGKEALAGDTAVRSRRLLGSGRVLRPSHQGRSVNLPGAAWSRAVRLSTMGGRVRQLSTPHSAQSCAAPPDPLPIRILPSSFVPPRLNNTQSLIFINPQPPSLYLHNGEYRTRWLRPSRCPAHRVDELPRCNGPRQGTSTPPLRHDYLASAIIGLPTAA